MDELDKQFFESILDTRSLTVIHYMIEDKRKQEPCAFSDVFKTMYETNDLDEIWMHANAQLGRVEEVARLRDWLHKKRMVNSLTNVCGIVL